MGSERRIIRAVVIAVFFPLVLLAFTNWEVWVPLRDVLYNRRRITRFPPTPLPRMPSAPRHARRDKKQDKKRKRGLAPRLALADDGIDSPAPEADASTLAVAGIPTEVATPA